MHAQALSKDPAQNLAEHNFRRNWGCEAPPRPERMAQKPVAFLSASSHCTDSFSFPGPRPEERSVPFPWDRERLPAAADDAHSDPAKVGPSIGIMSNCSSSGIPGFNLKPPSLASIRMKRGHAPPGIRL